MPRRRTSNRPIRRRIKLKTRQDAQSEMGWIYRAVDAGKMPPAEGTRRVFIIDKMLSSGLPDARAMSAGGGYTPPIIQILSVPSGCFLNRAQIEATERGEPFVDIALCTPRQLEHDEPPLLEHSPQVEPDEQHGEPAAIESAPPGPEPDPIMKRAMAMGYIPLPRRVRPVD
jgi:hypothetical protein